MDQFAVSDVLYMFISINALIFKQFLFCCFCLVDWLAGCFFKSV